MYSAILHVFSHDIEAPFPSQIHSRSRNFSCFISRILGWLVVDFGKKAGGVGAPSAPRYTAPRCKDEGIEWMLGHAGSPPPIGFSFILQDNSDSVGFSRAFLTLSVSHTSSSLRT